MKWLTLLTAVAVLTVATAFGGAAVRLAWLSETPAAVATILLVTGLLLVALVATDRSRRRVRTPYWR